MVATRLRATRRSWTPPFEGSAQFATRSRTVPGDEACDRSVTHPRLHLARTSGSDLPGAELGRCNGYLNQDLPRFAAMPRGSQAQSLAHSAMSPGGREVAAEVCQGQLVDLDDPVAADLICHRPGEHAVDVRVGLFRGAGDAPD